MRLARLAIPIAMLTLAVAGCGGGSKVVVEEVPGGTTHVTVRGGEALAPQATPTPTAGASATPTADATSTDGTNTAPTQQQQPQSTAQPQSTPTPQATPEGTAGGGATAPQATPQPGSDAQQFETFCQQNPGAC